MKNTNYRYLAGTLSRSCLLGLVLLLHEAGSLSAGEAPQGLKIICRDSYLPGVPVFIRIQVLDREGRPARWLWDGEAALATDPPGAAPVPSVIRLWNGQGSALVALPPGGGDIRILATAAAGGVSVEASRTLRSLEGMPVQTIHGALPAGTTEWSGIIRLDGSLTVPAGATLRLLPGTLALVDGALTSEGQPGECQSPASTPGKCGFNMTIQGRIESLGTEEQPVTITASDAARAWGEIHHNGAEPSSYQFTEITRAGNSSGAGHTGTGPAVRATNSAIRFENCSIADTAGKSMLAAGSDLQFFDCLLARSIMGPEIDGTSLHFERGYIEEMYGTDDNDGIYLHSQKEGQVITVKDSVIASGGDDGIDTLGSKVTIEGCLVRDFRNPAEDSKGISVFSGEARISRCLVVDNKVGISGKGENGEGATLWIDRTTDISVQVGIEANDKFGEPDLRILYFIDSCIIEAPDAVRTDYPPGDIQITYSSVSEAWPGSGNISADPAFADASHRDYHLTDSSPCIDSGDPDLSDDPDGTRADMGVFFHRQTEAGLFIRGRVNGDDQVDISDAVAALLHLFLGMPIGCLDAADANDDGALDVSDAVALLTYLLLRGPALPMPGGACAADPTDDPLDCVQPACL